MEFENLHEDVADLRARVEKLEARLTSADEVARAAMAEIKEHEAETEKPATEASDCKVSTPDHPQDGNVSGQE